MVDESFFLARWILAWSEMAWVQLRANMWLATMPPRLADSVDDTPATNLVVAFKVPLILRNVTGQTQGQHTLKNSRDLHLYPGTFEQVPSIPTELQCITVEQDEWTDH